MFAIYKVYLTIKHKTNSGYLIEQTFTYNNYCNLICLGLFMYIYRSQYIICSQLEFDDSFRLCGSGSKLASTVTKQLVQRAPTRSLRNFHL